MSNSESAESTIERPDRLAHQLQFCRNLEQRRGSGFIYVIQAGDFVKIGVAKDVKRRILMLQCGCPFRIELIAAIPCVNPYGVERRLHYSLRALRTNGEWFVAVRSEIDAAVLSVLNAQDCALTAIRCHESVR